MPTYISNIENEDCMERNRLSNWQSSWMQSDEVNQNLSSQLVQCDADTFNYVEKWIESSFDDYSDSRQDSSDISNELNNRGNKHKSPHNYNNDNKIVKVILYLDKSFKIFEHVLL